MSLCKQIKQALHFAKVLSLRQFLKTDEQKLAWVKFEKVLMYRAQALMICHMTVDSIRKQFYYGSVDEAYIDQLDKMTDKENAKLLLPYAQGARFFVILVGWILLLSSIKCLSVSRYYLYITSLLHVVYSFIPFDRDTTHARIEVGLQSAMEFTMCYFNWLPSLIISVLNLVWNQVGRAIVFNEFLDTKTSIDLGIDMFIVAVFCWNFHLVLSLFGKYFVETEILRQGNDELLDNLEEGVLIQEESSNRTIFINQSAKAIASSEWQENPDPQPVESDLFGNETSVFARVESQLEPGDLIEDVVNKVQAINAIDDYLTFQQVVD